MKKFILKFSLCVLIMAVFCFAFCFAVDSFNVFHPLNLRDNGVEPNKNFIKMSYILKNPEKFDSFIFGSSRVSSLHVEKLTDLHCYNMTYSGGLPAENLNNIKTLISEGIIPKKIYIGVDDASYGTDPAEHLTMPLRSPYEYSRSNPISFWKLYLDPAVIMNALTEVTLSYSPLDAEYAEKFYEYGWVYDYGYESSYNFDAAIALPSNGEYITETVSAIREIKEICDANGIELVLFTNPMYHVQLSSALENSYLRFLEELANVTPFYNFSSFNDITLDPSNYADVSHYEAEPGDLVLATLSGDMDPELLAQGFGVYVTADNVDELCALISSQQENLMG